ncbi:Exoskeleton protein RP43 [Holothuria leucospilota]|uniref:Exoskeleton protein RP43 n=1 Tax=Holothuria leucospilota TaxID=206669 RepID=A0A9Q1BTA1_HOLLE|nr:Exoskeleton protein RP43 [Holothuria leucospilota]
MFDTYCLYCLDTLCINTCLQFPLIYLNTDITYLTGSSGVFTSRGYPNTTAGWAQWNITVMEDRRILLRFLDFELHVSSPCILDSFVLYDGAYESELELGKFCWSSFEELDPSTYISSGHIFLLSLRTHGFYTRKGFKANYSSIPKDFKLTTASNVITTTVTTKPTLKGTTTLEKLPNVTPSSALTDILSSKTSTIRLSSEPSLPRASKNSATIPVIIAAIGIALLLVTLSFAIVMWKCKRSKSTNDAVSNRDEKSPPPPTSTVVTYEVVQQEKGSMNPTYYENQSEQQTNKALQQISVTHEESSPGNRNKDISDGIYETPDVEMYSYADPHEVQLYI